MNAAAQHAQLIIVGTPIGNLGDWSPRAQEALSSVALIACEDTRRTGLLLSKHGIANPGMCVANEHREMAASQRVLDVLAAGESVALVSDAGMPVISDPGALIVRAVAEAGHDVVVVPGPTAASAAVALAGFRGGRFVFEGFLPRKGKERRQRIAELASEHRIVVLYEAPHRIERTLTELAAAMDGERDCVIAREITKLHEGVWRGSLNHAAAAALEPRGEYVIVIDEAAPAGEATDAQLQAAVSEALASGLSTKDAAAEVAEQHGVGRRRVYELATRSSHDDG